MIHMIHGRRIDVRLWKCASSHGHNPHFTALHENPRGRHAAPLRGKTPTVHAAASETPNLKLLNTGINYGLNFKWRLSKLLGAFISFCFVFLFILMQVNESLQLVGKNVINPAALETGDDDHMLGRDLFHLQ